MNSINEETIKLLKRFQPYLVNNDFTGMYKEISNEPYEKRIMYSEVLGLILYNSGAFELMTEIPDYCFYNGLIEDLKLSDKCTKIGSCAFANNKKLKSVTLSNVEYIGSNAFFNCQDLASVKFSDSLKTINENAFWKCTSLTSIELPDSLQSISDNAFAQCTALTEISIPQKFKGSIKSIFSSIDITKCDIEFT